MPLPLDPRRKPAEIKVHVSTGAGVDIVWADGHRSHYDFAYLREMCPCAMCNDERRQEARHGGSLIQALSQDLFPMFKPKPRASAAKAIGNYALQIDFSDGHTAGIYSYEYLRTICPCEECVKIFRASAP